MLQSVVQIKRTSLFTIDAHSKYTDKKSKSANEAMGFVVPPVNKKKLGYIALNVTG